jgi:polysaccharide biosynthesis/export protein
VRAARESSRLGRPSGGGIFQIKMRSIFGASLMTKFMPVNRILPVLALLAFSAVAFAQSDSTAPAAGASNKQTEEKPAQGARGTHSDNAYIIGADDVLAINVWKEPEVSRSVPVRSDGKISLPLVGELTAGGQTPLHISEPEVTVIVQDSKSQRINILGMVVRPGAYLLTGSSTVLDAIAMAGGFKDFAKQKAIYVLRQNADGTQTRLGFNYKDVIKGHNPDQNVRLQPRDTVVVP